MERMIEAGRLDQPGKGFIYLYPVHHGVVDMKVHHGRTQHAASIEQIVATLDEIKGGAEWRRRTNTETTLKSSKRVCLINLIELKLYCDEGRADDLVVAAMAAGESGATISKLKHVCVADSPSSCISPAREVCSMIVQQKQVQNIVTSGISRPDPAVHCAADLEYV